MLNWRVRFKNKAFWLAFIPAILMVAKTIANLFGYVLDVDGVSQNLIAVVEAVFTVLMILGVVVDPTTSGISDSRMAMTYDEPHSDN